MPGWKTMRSMHINARYCMNGTKIRYSSYWSGYCREEIFLVIWVINVDTRMAAISIGNLFLLYIKKNSHHYPNGPIARK